MILDEPTVWPQRGRGGFMRNADGDALVSHPDGGKRKLAYGGGSSFWPFDPPFRGSAIYGQRGTHVHTICDHADLGEALSAELIDEGVSLGIAAELQAAIADGWLAFRKAHGITAMHIEAPYVNDHLKVASNADRIDELADATTVVGDIKTAANPIKAAYLAQLGTTVGATPYDTETDQRTEWVMVPSESVAYVYHYPIGEAIKAHDAGKTLPDWALIAVDLHHAAKVCMDLALLRDVDHAESFRKFATPEPSVESPGGDVATHGTAATSPLTLAEWRALAATWDDDKGEAFSRYRFNNGITADADEAERLAAYESFNADYTFADVAAPPPEPRPTPEPAPVRPRRKPAEGKDVSSVDAADMRQRYEQLDDSQRSLIASITTDANRAGVGFHMNLATGGKHTLRRFEIARGLMLLAIGDFDYGAVRACLGKAIGDELAQSMSFTLGELVGCMSYYEASVFAETAADLADGGYTLDYGDDGCRLGRAA